MSNIITSGIDRQNRHEADMRRQNRKRYDIEQGRAYGNIPQRGDYGLCRDLDKTLKDYHKYKNPKDRVKIDAEYFGKQRQYQRNHVLGK